MRTRASARLAKMPPLAMPLTISCSNCCMSSSPLVPEVGPAHRLLPLQICAQARDRDSAHLEHVRMRGQLERQAGILFHQQDGNVIDLVDVADDLKDRSDDQRCQSE